LIRVRFAPTPSGPLFVSGLRVALANVLFAGRDNGHVLLRFDDLDTAKCPPANAEQIMQDLRWFGLGWNETIRQSDRRALYEVAVGRLKEQGVLYPCFESQEELAAKQEFRRKRRQPLIYDRAMLKLTPAQRGAAEAGGKRPHWRLRLSGRTLAWRDMVLGDRQAALAAVSDPVLVLADGTPAPILASVVDDVDTGITHIIRGEDNAANTAIQLELFELLTGRPPAIRLGYLPALLDDAHAKPGRRVANLPVRTLRADGIEPDALAACIAGLASQRVAPPPLAAWADHFDLAALAAAKFDAKQLLAANRQVLREMAFGGVTDRLPAGATERFWLAVRGDLDLLKEARGWWEVVAGTIVPPVVEGERDLLVAAGTLLPTEPWDDSVWTQWIGALEQSTGRAGEALLLPLRLALTGEDTGPDLAGLLPLIGRARATERLSTAAA
jgi:glutamyl-tRNA synthetase